MIEIKIDKAKKCNGDWSMFVTFPYNQKVVEVIRTCADRSWDKNKKEWELSVKFFKTFIDSLQDFDFDIHGNWEAFAEKKTVALPNFNFKTTPFQHQVEGFNYGLNNDRWLLGDEQGLGKTKQVIDIAVAKKQLKGYKHCLIICGVNGLKWNWVNEVHTHSNEDAWILGQRTRNHKTVIGSTADKLADLNALRDISSYFLITNIESMRNEQIVAKIAKYAKDGTIGIVAIDEIHKCFDYDTLITTDIGTLKIGDIVKDQISCSVLSYNETTGENEWKRITDWHENIVAEQLLELQFETENGIKIIKCTKGHKFFTKNRGWVRAEDLTSYDDIQEF